MSDARTLSRRAALRFRPATDADAAWATAVYNTANPDQPQDVVYTRWVWGLDDADWLDRRYVVELEAKPLGWLMLEYVVWSKNPGRHASIDAWLHPKLQSPQHLGEIFGHMEDEGRDIEAKVLGTSVRETAPKILAALLRRSYLEVGRQRYWELDLVRHRERLLALVDQARVGTGKLPIRLLTLAEDDDPDIEDDLFSLYVETRRDMPASTPWVPWSKALFLEWLNDPHKRRDRFWIARVGGELAGMSVLAYPQSDQGVVDTSWTGVGREHRGLGLARALKLETLAQAIDLEVPRVRTDNDSTNAPILHLNEELGYTEVPGHVKLQLKL